MDRYRVKNIKEKLRYMNIILVNFKICIIEILEGDNSVDGSKVDFLRYNG